MWMSRWFVLATLTLAAGCGDEPTAVCNGSEPVHLLRRDELGDLTVARAGDYTFIHALDYRGEQQVVAGRACGVDPVPLYEGLRMLPMRMHADPRDDDPTIVCSEAGSLFRIDPDGDAAPTVLLPDLDCRTRRQTAHGLLLRSRVSLALIGVSDFDDAGSAVVLAEGFDPTIPIQVLGDEIFYVRPSGQLRVQDVGSGRDSLLRTGVAAFEATATHVLWREVTGATVAPMRLLDRATGTSTYLGLFHADEDVRSTGNTRYAFTDNAWSFLPGGEHVVHVPFVAHAPMAAYDLRGRPVEFPAWGTPYRFFLDGTVLVHVAGESFAVRAGARPVAVDIDVESGPIEQVAGDALEYRADSQLYRAALDGSPRRLIARGVGPAWSWIDDEHILTVHDYALTTIDVATTHRSVLAYPVLDFTVVPGAGVYYAVTSQPGHPANGLWYLPKAGLRPPPPRCIYFEACD